MKTKSILFVSLLALILGVITLPSVSQADPFEGGPNDLCVSLQFNLKYKSSDANTAGEVSVLQDYLQSSGYLTTDPTGYFNLTTVTATKAFQKANSLSADGSVGPITRAKIKELTCSDIIAPTVGLSAEPEKVNYGGSSVLTWDSFNVNSCVGSFGGNVSKTVPNNLTQMASAIGAQVLGATTSGSIILEAKVVSDCASTTSSAMSLADFSGITMPIRNPNNYLIYSGNTIAGQDVPVTVTGKYTLETPKVSSSLASKYTYCSGAGQSVTFDSNWGIKTLSAVFKQTLFQDTGLRGTLIFNADITEKGATVSRALTQSEISQVSFKVERTSGLSGMPNEAISQIPNPAHLGTYTNIPSGNGSIRALYDITILSSPSGYSASSNYNNVSLEGTETKTILIHFLAPGATPPGGGGGDGGGNGGGGGGGGNGGGGVGDSTTACMQKSKNLFDISSVWDPIVETQIYGDSYNVNVVNDKAIVWVGHGKAISAYDVGDIMNPKKIGGPFPFPHDPCNAYDIMDYELGGTHCRYIGLTGTPAVVDGVPYAIIPASTAGWEVVDLAKMQAGQYPYLNIGKEYFSTYKKADGTTGAHLEGLGSIGGITVFKDNKGRAYAVGALDTRVDPKDICLASMCGGDKWKEEYGKLWIYDFSDPKNFNYETNINRRVAQLLGPNQTALDSQVRFFVGKNSSKTYLGVVSVSKRRICSDNVACGDSGPNFFVFDVSDGAKPSLIFSLKSGTTNKADKSGWFDNNIASGWGNAFDMDNNLVLGIIREVNVINQKVSFYIEAVDISPSATVKKKFLLPFSQGNRAFIAQSGKYTIAGIIGERNGANQYQAVNVYTYPYDCANCKLADANGVFDQSKNKDRTDGLGVKGHIVIFDSAVGFSYKGSQYLLRDSAIQPDIIKLGCPASPPSGGNNKTWPGPKTLSGYFSTGPLINTTTYNLSCTNDAGASVSDSATVTVLPGSLPPPPSYPPSTPPGPSGPPTISSIRPTGCLFNSGIDFSTNPSCTSARIGDEAQVVGTNFTNGDVILVYSPLSGNSSISVPATFVSSTQLSFTIPNTSVGLHSFAVRKAGSSTISNKVSLTIKAGAQ